MNIFKKNFAVTVLWIFSRKTVQSLCCYDYFQEKLCRHCAVMIILREICAITVLLWLFSRKTVQSLWCYDYFQEKLCSHSGVTIIFKKTLQLRVVRIIFKKNFEGKKIWNVLSLVKHATSLQSVITDIAESTMWRGSCIHLVNGEIYFREY